MLLRLKNGSSFLYGMVAMIEARHFKFGIQIDYSMCQPVDDKFPQKGRRQGFATHFLNLWDPSLLPLSLNAANDHSL